MGKDRTIPAGMSLNSFMIMLPFPDNPHILKKTLKTLDLVILDLRQHVAQVAAADKQNDSTPALDLPIGKSVNAVPNVSITGAQISLLPLTTISQDVHT